VQAVQLALPAPGVYTFPACSMNDPERSNCRVSTFGWLCCLPLLVATLSSAAEPASPKVRLVFSIDQGFGNGLVVNGDVEAVGRICTALRALRPRYDVFALFNPQVQDKRRLEAALDRAVREDVPFYLVVQSSDGMTLGSWSPPNAAADPTHGITIGLPQLKEYKLRYGKALAGIQFFEVFSQDFTLRAGRTKEPGWIDTHWKLPPAKDGFFRPDLAAPYLNFARAQHLQVQWSDWHWTHFATWDTDQKPQEEQFKKLLGQFRGLITVCYANNEPQEQSAARLMNWHEAMQPFVQAGAKDFGLSCQSWLRKDETRTPVKDLIDWSRRALDLGCTMIQYEPVWYFFKAPRGVFAPHWQPAAENGVPTGQFTELVSFLNAYPREAKPTARPGSRPAPEPH
jgi:hypothetical protein